MRSFFDSFNRFFCIIYRRQTSNFFLGRFLYYNIFTVFAYNGSKMPTLGFALNILLKLFYLFISSNLKNFNSCHAFFNSYSRCYNNFCSFWIILKSYSRLGRSSNSCFSYKYYSSIILILFLFYSIMLPNYFLIYWVHYICSWAIAWTFFSWVLFIYYSRYPYYCFIR